MTDDRLDARVDDVRRKLLKTSAVVGGGMVLGHLTYQKPAWKSFFGVRSAWAQPTSTMQLVLSGQLGTLAPGSADATGQDCWEFDSGANNLLTINATPDAFLDVELFLYAPGAVGFGQPNLLTNGTPFGFDVTGLGAAESVQVFTPTTGRYTICIEDARTPGNEQAGMYTIVVDSTRPMGPATMTVDEGPESDSPSVP